MQHQEAQRLDDRRHRLVFREYPETPGHRIGRNEAGTGEQKSNHKVAEDTRPFGTPGKQAEHDRCPRQRERAQQQDSAYTELADDSRIRSKAEYKGEQQDEQDGNGIEHERGQDMSGKH
jgi:hypothetical protein